MSALTDLGFITSPPTMPKVRLPPRPWLSGSVTLKVSTVSLRLSLIRYIRWYRRFRSLTLAFICLDANLFKQAFEDAQAHNASLSGAAPKEEQESAGAAEPEATAVSSSLKYTFIPHLPCLLSASLVSLSFTN